MCSEILTSQIIGANSSNMFLYVLLLIPLYYAYHRIKYRHKYELGNKLPGPFSLPLLGSVALLVPRKSEDVVRYLKIVKSRYGGIMRVWIGTKLAFFTTDPKIVEVILRSSTKYLAKSDLYGFLTPWLGDGLLLSKGKKWHSRRKIITPAFHFKILEEFIDIFDKQSSILIEKLKRHDNGEVINIHKFITLMALDIVCETAMGTKIEAQSNTNSAYVRAVHDLSHIIATKFNKLWQRNEFLFTFFSNQTKMKQDEAIRIMHDFSRGIIIDRRKQLLQTKSEPVDLLEDSEIGHKRKMALLDVLLQSTIDGVYLSNDDIQEEVDTFMFEGHDTTTSAICSALFLLSRHKDIQDKLFAEVRQVYNLNKDTVTYQQLQELKYTELVIKEAMRLYPPVPIIGRRLEEDTPINDKWTIPADSNLTIDFYTMFRDPNVFENPDTFNPERFNSELLTMDATNTYAYIPFSAGSRNCIGQKFAMLEMKSTISKIILHFELLPQGEEPIPLMELILRSMNGIQLGLKRRILI